MRIFLAEEYLHAGAMAVVLQSVPVTSQHEIAEQIVLKPQNVAAFAYFGERDRRFQLIVTDRRSRVAPRSNSTPVGHDGVFPEVCSGRFFRIESPLSMIL